MPEPLIFRYFCSMNPKKCTSVFLAMLILVTNIGLAFNVHYCGGKVASISSIFHSGKVCSMEKRVVEKACCAKKIAEEHQRCCKDKKVTLKNSADNGVVKVFSFQLDTPIVLHNESPSFPEAQSESIPQEKSTHYYCDAHSPPLFKLYSCYLLYA